MNTTSYSFAPVNLRTLGSHGQRSFRHGERVVAVERFVIVSGEYVDGSNQQFVTSRRYFDTQGFYSNHTAHEDFDYALLPTGKVAMIRAKQTWREHGELRTQELHRHFSPDSVVLSEVHCVDGVCVRRRSFHAEGDFVMDEWCDTTGRAVKRTTASRQLAGGAHKLHTWHKAESGEEQLSVAEIRLSGVDDLCGHSVAGLPLLRLL